MYSLEYVLFSSADGLNGGLRLPSVITYQVRNWVSWGLWSIMETTALFARRIDIIILLNCLLLCTNKQMCICYVTSFQTYFYGSNVHRLLSFKLNFCSKTLHEVVFKHCNRRALRILTDKIKVIKCNTWTYNLLS